MRQTIVIIVISSIILTILTFSYNYVNVCVSDSNNSKYTISECIDNNLINSILILISGIALVYIAILLLKFNSKPTEDEKQKLLNDYYSYYHDKKAKEAEEKLKEMDRKDKEN